jgi:hypothetical protein
MRKILMNNEEDNIIEHENEVKMAMKTIIMQLN